MTAGETPGVGRLVAVATALLLLVGGGAWVLFRATVSEPTVRPVVAPEPALALAHSDTPRVAMVATVLEVRGSAERERSGVWVPLKAGDALTEQDGVRTSATGGVDLQIGDSRSRITVAGGTTLNVRELSSEVHRLGLTRGRLTADYEENGTRALRIEGAGGAGGAVASTRGARFTVLSSGTAVAVATQRGEVGLASGGATVMIPAGSQSVALAAAAPSAAAPIPLDVLLRVARLAAADTLCARVKGVVRPGSQVRLDEEEIPVAADGTFELAVPRKAGLTGVKVAVLEPSGLGREQLIPCRSVAKDAQPVEEPSDVKIDWTQP